jgi:hypothetical protein
MARRPSNPLSEHARALQEEHERILREMAETEKALRQKPKAPARTKPEPERKVRINTSVAASINLPRPHDHIYRGGGSGPRRATRRRKTDARLAQIKFLLLCLLLAALVLFVWKNLPG